MSLLPEILYSIFKNNICTLKKIIRKVVLTNTLDKFILYTFTFASRFTGVPMKKLSGNNRLIVFFSLKSHIICNFDEIVSVMNCASKKRIRSEISSEKLLPGNYSTGKKNPNKREKFY